jgi:hypothetical protein
MTQLVYGLGYSSHHPANLICGKLAKLLCELLGWHYGAKINVFALFIPPERSNKQWQPVMRPKVMKALSVLQWV